MKRSIKRKYVMASAIIMIVSISVVLLISLKEVTQYSETTSKNNAVSVAKSLAAKIATELGNTMSSINTFSEILASTKDQAHKVNISRKDMLNQSRYLVSSSESLLGLCVIFEPNAFDGNDAIYKMQDGSNEDGRINLYFAKNSKGEIVLEDEHSSIEENEDYKFYFDTKRKLTDVLSEPSYYPVDGVDVLSMSLTTPITYQNKFLGVISADITVKELQNTIEKVDKFHKDININFCTENGILVASEFYKNSLGKNLSKVNPNLSTIFSNIKQSKAYSQLSKDTLSIFIPFTVGTYKTPWYINVNVPTHIISEASNRLMMIVIPISIVVALLGLTLLYFFAHRISKPIGVLTQMTKEIADGNFSNNIEFRTGDEIEELANSFNSVTISVKSVISDLNTLSTQTMNGNLSYRAESINYKGEYQSLIDGINATLDSVISPLQSTILILGSLSDGTLPQIINEEYKGDFNAIKDSINTLIHTLSAMQADGALLIKGVQDGIIQDVRADASKHKGIYFDIIQGFNDTLDTIAAPIVEMYYLLEKLAAGDLSARMVAEYNGSFELLKNNLNNTLNSLPLEEITQVMAAMADGDLTVNMIKEYKGDNLKIKESVNATLESLNQILGNVKSTVDEVTRASMQVSDTSQALSQGATQQAASLEEITSSMHQIGAQTRRNAENANVANTLSTNARDAAERGNSEMGQLTEAMTEINTSSNNISKIIKVIDDIAFQTNLLALNAAVEAARAGRHGKGFAVVAEEVRSLAARSATAAKETSEMIEHSIKTVDRGAELVQKTGEALMEIQQEAVKVADIIGEINTSSNEQAQGIAQINEGLSQIDRVTQTNTASAEESASAAEELSGQASQLRELVDRFKLTNNGGSGSYSMRLNNGRNRSLNRYNS